ncbi:MAG: hypothetical protein LC099_10875 [Anaerolineales bacterium]|nr:hypothetical protein [Anaerolineales bacterium]
MIDDLNLSNINVENMLQTEPDAVRFFLDRKLRCVGCEFARFCTLGDVVRMYHLDEQEFMEAAKQIVFHTKPTRNSE